MTKPSPAKLLGLFRMEQATRRAIAEDIAALIAAGWSYRSLSEATGIPTSTLYSRTHPRKGKA